MFISKIHTYYCTEGDKIELTWSVYTDSIKVEWYKDGNKLHECTNMSITTKAIFKRRLVDRTNMEGLDTNLECETVEENCNVQWLKDNVQIIDQPDKMKKEKTQGRLHTLFISKTRLEDRGTYSIRIKGAKSVSKLDVKEMPETIKRMSIHDREEFLKAAKSVTTKRYTVRVMIVEEQNVGKTCLFRRLMNEEVTNVDSTDGINIERRKCQINIETGEWHFLSDYCSNKDCNNEGDLCIMSKN